MMTKLKEAVKELVAQELFMASKDYGDRFHSAHEAYAVIKEEYEEAIQELGLVDVSLYDFWQCVKSPQPYNDFKDVSNGYLNEMEKTAINAACECVQVAAMARKARAEYGDSKHE